MLKIGDSQVKKVIVQDKNGNVLTSDLDKIVCNETTVFVKQCNLTVRLYYGYSDYSSYTWCGETSEKYYPLPLRFYASWGITEKIKSVAFNFSSYQSDCFSNVTNNTTITTNGETKTISAKRSWSSENGGYIGFETPSIVITLYDDTVTYITLHRAGLLLKLSNAGEKNQYKTYENISTV